MRCLRSWLQCVSRLRSFHRHQVRSKRERHLPFAARFAGNIGLRSNSPDTAAPFLSVAKTLRQLNFIHVANYSSCVVDFKYAPNFGEAQALARLDLTEFAPERSVSLCKTQVAAYACMFFIEFHGLF